jgi:hypothetical protein
MTESIQSGMLILNKALSSAVVESTFRPGKMILMIRLRMRVGWRRGIFVSFLMFDLTVMICISMYYCPMRAAVAFLHRPKK